MPENTGRLKRYMDLARKVAEESESTDYRHGAVLTRGAAVISTSCNKNGFKGFGQRFRDRDCGHATRHAELGVILGVDRSKTTGAVVYVARIGKAGELRLSKPCNMCRAVLEYVGVKKVFYSINENEIGVIKL